MDQKWISLAAAARYTGLSVITMRRMVRQGRIRAVRVNGARVWRTTGAWVDEGMAAGAATTGRVTASTMLAAAMTAGAGAEDRDE